MFYLHGFMGSKDDFGFLPDDFYALDYLNAFDQIPDKNKWDGIGKYLWSQIEEPTPSIFGYSMGGRLALSMLAEDPNRIQKLVLCGAQFRKPEDYLERRVVDDKRADFLRNQPLDFLNWWASLELFGPQLSKGWEKLGARRKREIESTSLAWANLLQALSVSVQPDFSELIKAHAKKITFSYGEEDKKYRAFVDDYRALGVRCIGVPDAWHAVHIDNPAGLLSLIEGL